MRLWELFLIAVGLSMDAFAVSISNGAVYCEAKFKDALKTGAFFGIFQAVMPMIGWLAGSAFTQFISSVDHWIALILLGYLGGKMIYEAFRRKRTPFPARQRMDISRTGRCSPLPSQPASTRWRPACFCRPP